MYYEIYYNYIMILGEKPGREFPAAISSKRLIVKDDSCTFDDVVSKACEGLIDRQVKYTIRRINEMEKCLLNLERELDEFLIMKN